MRTHQHLASAIALDALTCSRNKSEAFPVSQRLTVLCCATDAINTPHQKPKPPARIHSNPCRRVFLLPAYCRLMSLTARREDALLRDDESHRQIRHHVVVWQTTASRREFLECHVLQPSGCRVITIAGIGLGQN
jgi:hypothetical protein